VSTQTQPKRQPPARTVLDDLADLEARKVQIDARRTEVTRILHACHRRAAALEEQRNAEVTAAVHDLRDPVIAATEKDLLDEQGKVAALADQIAALKTAVGEVDKQIASLRRGRRGEFIALARANAEAVVAPAQERLIDAARKLAAAVRENGELWRSAFADTGRGPLNPELPLGTRVDARLPGGSLATRCTVPRANRVVVNDAELFQTVGTLAVLIDHLERYGNIGMPAAVVPANALQGRPGIYRDSVLGGEHAIDHATLNAPTSWFECTVDEHGMSRFVWIAPLPAGATPTQPTEREAA
jgi:hypothetical protein